VIRIPIQACPASRARMLVKIATAAGRFTAIPQCFAAGRVGSAKGSAVVRVTAGGDVFHAAAKQASRSSQGDEDKYSFHGSSIL